MNEKQIFHCFSNSSSLVSAPLLETFGFGMEELINKTESNWQRKPVPMMKLIQNGLNLTQKSYRIYIVIVIILLGIVLYLCLTENC